MKLKRYRTNDAELISYICRDTAYGLVLMAVTDKGICFLQFGESKTALVDALKKEFPDAELNISPPQGASVLENWIDALNLYLSEGAPKLDLPLDVRGTEFQIKVWQFLISTQEGDRLSYSEVAAFIGNPKAIRPVATACARNRIGVLIPCHRVLKSDGSLGGYRWGVARKKALLDAERKRMGD